MKKTFKGSSLENCIEKAVEGLCISKEKLKYKIVEEKKSFFGIKVTIEVEFDENHPDTLSCKVVDDTDNNSEEVLNENNGSVKVEDGVIKVKEAKEGGKPAIIIKPKDLKLIIDGKGVAYKAEVYKDSKIEYFFNESMASRNLNFKISEDKMKAYVDVTYKPQVLYKVEDATEKNELLLQVIVDKKTNPVPFTVGEIKEELTKNNVIYGIIEENFGQLVKGTGEKVLIAEGTPVLNDISDTIDIKFKTSSDLSNLVADKTGNIDFKNIGAVEAVKKGDILAVKIIGEEGHDGIDVYNKTYKRKLAKNVVINAGKGCIKQDEYTMVAAMDGKPCVRNNLFQVFQIHEVKADVDMSTGNVKFIGDVVVNGSVKEGMEVECGNSLEVRKNVERATLIAKGDIDVKGKIIAATILGGGDDVVKLKIINDINALLQTLKDMDQAVVEIKKYDLLGKGLKDCDIIKLLIENKFKQLPKICFNIVSDFNLIRVNNEKENLVHLIKAKLLGLAVFNIKHYYEIEEIVAVAEQKLQELNETLSLPVTVKFDYAQDSKISSSGDVVVSGKGVIITDIEVNGGIYFNQANSVTRGGSLKAKKEIKVKLVGSSSGVATRLTVEQQGHIYVEKAYQNTVFRVGAREYILDIPSKDIHVYADERGDLIIDKLKM